MVLAGMLPAPEFTAANGRVFMANAPLQLKGASWFGLEGVGKVPDGLWVHNTSYYLHFLAAHGFNAIRLPFALDNIQSNSVPNKDMMRHEPSWWGLQHLDIMENIVDMAADYGLLVLFDLQRLQSDAWPDAGLWYNHQVSIRTVMDTWDIMQSRFCSKWNTLGADLLNEPHGAPWNEWAATASSLGNFILSKCPRWLMFVEGVAHKGVPEQAEYFWGENLASAGNEPVQLNLANKLVYSPHVRLRPHCLTCAVFACPLHIHAISSHTPL